MWYKVYDIIEGIYSHLATPHRGIQAEAFEREINQCYRELGIGWQLVSGQHETRGDDAFEATLKTAKDDLSNASLPTSSNELSEAIQDLSRRPEPDLSGAAQHAMNALEAVTRRTTGEKGTLGDIVKKNADLFPAPLNDCVAKAWGYASENARHGRENRTLGFEEVKLIVGLSAVLSSYLTAKTSAERSLR